MYYTKDVLQTLHFALEYMAEVNNLGEKPHALEMLETISKTSMPEVLKNYNSADKQKNIKKNLSAILALNTESETIKEKVIQKPLVDVFGYCATMYYDLVRDPKKSKSGPECDIDDSIVYITCCVLHILKPIIKELDHWCRDSAISIIDISNSYASFHHPSSFKMFQDYVLETSVWPLYHEPTKKTKKSKK